MEILVDGVHYTLNAGDLCVIFPNILHSIIDQNTTKYLIMLSPALLPEHEKLLHSSQSVTAIAYACGFPNQSSFNRAFLKYCGENPTEHRRNLRSHGNAL